MRATLALVDVRSCKLRYVKDNSSSLLQQLGGHSPMRVLFLKWLLVAPVPDAQGKGCTIHGRAVLIVLTVWAFAFAHMAAQHRSLSACASCGPLGQQFWTPSR